MPLFAPPVSPEVVAAVQGLKWANGVIPAGNTVTATTETAFATGRTIPAGALVPGSAFRTTLFGRYSPVGLTQSITPRLRLGGVNLLTERVVMGLLGSASSPWAGVVAAVVTDTGIVSAGYLHVADDTVRLYGGPVTSGINLGVDNALVASGQWGGAGNAITLQGLLVEIIKAVG